MSKKVASKKKAAAKKTAARKGTAGKKTASKKKAASRKGAREKHPGGRPTKYTDDMPQRLLDYFNISEPFEVREGLGGKVLMAPVKFPTLARFAAANGVTRVTLHAWANEKDENGELLKPEFSYAYARAKEFQEALLIEGGMAGAFQHTFATFAAKNLLGWTDKQDLSHTSPDGSMTPRPAIDASKLDDHTIEQLMAARNDEGESESH